MSDNKNIRFIKPCRTKEEDHRALTPQYAIELLKTGRIAQINLDNCALQRMEQLPLNPTEQDAEQVGLLPLIQILQRAPIAMTAIGLNEMPDCHVAGAKLAYERFCSTFWPDHKDDIDATHRAYDESSTDRKVEFFELDDGARCTYGAAYISILQMQNINRTYTSLSPEEKFQTYLHSIIGMLDVVSAFELEIAKYAFWHLTDREINLLPEPVRVRRKDIRENFTKPQGSFSKCKNFAFNGAMDLYWLSGANLSEDLGLTLDVGACEFTVDSWVGTNDIKLYRISKDIHSVASDDSTMKALAVSRESQLKASPYWQCIDGITENVLRNRKLAGYGKVDQLLEKIDRAVVHLEGELQKAFSE